jgi:antitoxin component YwqK of YwqJK toxin-antitoxin module
MRKKTIGILSLIALSVIVYLIFQNDGKEKIYYPDGKLKQTFSKEGGKINGVVTNYFESGNVKSEIEFQEGEQTGKARFYYESGELEKVATFKRGIENDTSRFFYKSGVPKETVNFQGGRREGIFSAFFQNGRLKTKGEFKNNRRIGDWLLFDSLGSVVRIVYYVSDTVQSIYENSVYRSFLSGYQVKVPLNFKKIAEYKNGVILSGVAETSGAVTISIGKKSFTTKSLKQEVEKEISDAKIKSPDLRIIEKKHLSDSTIRIEFQGTQKINSGVTKFDSKFLVANHNHEFYIFSSYVSIDKGFGSEYSKIDETLNQFFASIILENPQIIVDPEVK